MKPDPDLAEEVGIAIRFLAEAVAVILFLGAVAAWAIILGTRVPT